MRHRCILKWEAEFSVRSSHGVKCRQLNYTQLITFFPKKIFGSFPGVVDIYWNNQATSAAVAKKLLT